MSQPPDRLRVDKWLWAARFFKTRSLAAEEIDRGRVDVNGQTAKPSRELKAGDRLDIRLGGGEWRTVEVVALSTQRGPASVAQLLYRETAESLDRRAALADRRRLAAEPGESLQHGRPTKRDRRKLADWQRWSAEADRSRDR